MSGAARNGWLTERRRRLLSLAAFATGVVIFVTTLYYVDFQLVRSMGRRLGYAVLLSLAASAVWHAARTWAWWWCFPSAAAVPFLRLARVRLAAEAFSYLTLRGVAGEPLKVMLLAGEIDPRVATAAVALERLSYLVGTTLIVGIASVAAMVALPLTHTWFRIFRAFSIVAAVVTLLAAVVVAGRGSYLRRLLERLDRGLGTSVASGRVGRFAAAVERQLLELVRGHPLRLAILSVATLVAYTAMVAEAWFILSVAGVDVSFTGAFAVETFSRVASFASAFIPANLGALEASSLAAASAVGAAGAGAALALTRRLRGLFWAGVGLAVYPRTGRLRGTAGSRQPAPPSSLNAILLYLPTDPAVSVPPLARVAGLPIEERVLRAAFRAGYQCAIVLARGELAGRMRQVAHELGADVRIVADDQEWGRALAGFPLDAPATAIGAGTVVSPALLAEAAGLMPLRAAHRDVPAGPDWPVSGLIRVRIGAAGEAAALRAALRERICGPGPRPTGEDVSSGRARLALRAVAALDLAGMERDIRRSSYKDTDNTLARFNRRMSLPISVALIRTPLTANQLSISLVAVGFYAAWLFSLGHYWPGVLGAFLSLAASVLDGSDGEIARLKYQESSLGCWLETFGDYAYYIAIFMGLTSGAAHRTGWPGFYWIGGVALAGSLVTFALLIYLRSRITAGQPEKLHAIARVRFQAEPSWWSRMIWRISFVATRSAMPYGIMALALVGGLPVVVVLAAVGANVYWIAMMLKLRHLLGGEERLAVTN